MACYASSLRLHPGTKSRLEVTRFGQLWPAVIVQIDCIVVPKADQRRLAFKIDLYFQAMPLVKHSSLGGNSLEDMRGTC